jgi:hypothetical protein
MTTRNYHRKDCPWFGVNLDDDIAVDEMGGTDPEFGGTPCVCTDSDWERAVLESVAQHERDQDRLIDDHYDITSETREGEFVPPLEQETIVDDASTGDYPGPYDPDEDYVEGRR